MISKKEWLSFDLESRSIEEKDFLDMETVLELDVDLSFNYKEMKINNNFEYIFACSLDKKIKANCNYTGILFLDYEQYNNNIGQVYFKIEKEIKESIEEIKKGWLFNSEDRYESKINIIMRNYNDWLNDIKAIKADYFMRVEENPNYEFGCSILKIENNFSSVKRADFILGIESFLKIANYWSKIEEYKLWLKEQK